jgi:hypothetical protein
MKHLVIGFLALLTCLCFYFVQKDKFSRKPIIWIVYSGALGLSIYLFCSNAFTTFTNPPIWDFSAFYLWGKAAHAGYDVYSPENLSIVFKSLNLPPLDYKEFVGEIVNVGFFYPPQSILYFAPLGYFSYYTAFTIWAIFNLVFALCCIYLIYDHLFKSYKLNGLILVSTLFMLYPPVRLTIIFSQTNFILLFYLLMIGKYSDKKFSGIFLALAVFTKPYMIILGVFFLLKKNWGAIIYSALSVLAISGLTLLFFGQSIFLNYLSENPARRMPPALFSEGINQSLHAVLLRAKLITLNNPSLYTYIALAILLLTGIYLYFLMKRRLYNYILPVLLLIGLLIYPGTLSYYAVLLLFIIFQFYNERAGLGFRSFWGPSLIVGGVFLLSSFSVFLCICFLLLVLVLKSFNRTTSMTAAIAV